MNTHFLKVLICYLLLPSLSFAGVVFNLEDKGKGSLRWAIENAREGEIITFSPDIIGRTIVLNSPVRVPAKSISLLGPDRQIILSAPYCSVFADVSSALFNITGISFRDAVAILRFRSEGSINIENCSFRNIQTCFPEQNGSLKVSNSSFYKNKNILIRGGKKISFYNCSIESNRGILISSQQLEQLSLERCHFEDNQAQPGKGLIQFEGNKQGPTQCKIHNCKFINNSMPQGAILQSLLRGGTNHKIDLQGILMSNNRGKILFSTLEEDAVLMLNEAEIPPEIGPCGDGDITRVNSPKSILLGEDSFPNFCEGFVIWCRSPKARFVHLISGEPHKLHSEANCCRKRIKVF